MTDGRKVHVVKSDPPESTEILAEAIIRISEGHRRLEKSGLNQDAIVALLKDYTRLPKRDIITILDALNRLAGYYCK